MDLVEMSRREGRRRMCETKGGCVFSQAADVMDVGGIVFSVQTRY